LKTVAGNLSDQRLRKSIIRILRDSELCSIATLDPRNRPHINTAYFCYRGLDDLEVFFLSDIKSLQELVEESVYGDDDLPDQPVLGRSWPWTTTIRYMFPNRRKIGPEGGTSVREAVSILCEVDVQ